MKTIAFRIWDKERKKFWDSGSTPLMLKSFFENTAVLNTRDEMPYQQYTGLSDKNQVWIYEGDITNYGEVVWVEQPAAFMANPSKENTDISFMESFSNIYDDEDLEVIGNIYENKENLKQRSLN